VEFAISYERKTLNMEDMILKKTNKTILITIILTLVLAIAFAGCTPNTAQTDAGQNEALENLTDAEAAISPINVAVLNGPTGIGAVKLMDNPRYNVSVYQSPAEMIGRIVTGEVEVAAVPANLAATLYNRTEGQIVALGPIALGVLFIAQNVDDENAVISSISDLEGQTILAGGRGSTTEHILSKLLQSAGLDIESDVNMEWFLNHSEVNAMLVTRPGAIAMIPEPFVSIAKSNNEDVRMVLDLNEAWRSATDGELTMSVLIAQASFVQENPDLHKMLLSDFESSIYFVNNSQDAPQLIAEWGFIPDVDIARKAIPGCNLVFFEDRQIGAAFLRAFLEILYEIDAESIGGSLPNDTFYY
jgi:NitT/TauT family transport system substrate-binding protein